MAGWGRRILALLLDWAVANLGAFAIVRDAAIWQAPQTWLDLVPLGVFAVELWVLTGLLGFSIGHRALGLGVVRLNSRPVGLARALLRTALILLVVPPLVQDADGRGLHDRVAGTVILRVR